ncbi:MAG: efflux RND transporter periplasmic adaptor subunit [Pseudomonadales bacterium]
MADNEHSRKPWLQHLSVAIGCLLVGTLQAETLSEVDFDCLIEPKMTVMIGAATQGVIHSVDVQRNEQVKAGQLLATLESKVEQAALAHARVRATMKSEIQARRADLKLAEVNNRRIQELFKKKMVPSQQVDEAVGQLEVARMSVKQAEDNRTLYEHEFARALQVVQQHVIRSPIDGVVVEQRAYPGEFVYENPVLAIAQVDPLRVEAILPARFYGLVDQGMRAVIEPEIKLSGPMSVKISGIDRIIDAASGTFSVHLDLPNPKHKIPGGQRCTLTFIDPGGDDQLAQRTEGK